MHKNSYEIMSDLSAIALTNMHTPSQVLDVGSKDVNGTYKPLFHDHDYTGLDAKQGSNVDVVGDAYELPFPDNSFDLVVSGNLLEHLAMPYLAVQEMKRVVRKNGYVIIIAPYSIHEHKYPLDYFRFLPDAFREFLFGFEDVEAGIKVPDEPLGSGVHSDTWAIGKKGVENIRERWISTRPK